MLEDYQNKVCVVTGAASGIGKALCEKLVALGAQVYALDLCNNIARNRLLQIRKE